STNTDGVSRPACGRCSAEPAGLFGRPAASSLAPPAVWRGVMGTVTYVASGLFVLALAACGKSPEERMASAIASAASGADVSVEDEGERVVLGTGDEAMTISSGDSASLPANFPKDVFLPDDYTIESALDSAGFSMVSLRTPGEVDKLADAADR